MMSWEIGATVAEVHRPELTIEDLETSQVSLTTVLNALLVLQGLPTRDPKAPERIVRKTGCSLESKALVEYLEAHWEGVPEARKSDAARAVRADLRRRYSVALTELDVEQQQERNAAEVLSGASDSGSLLGKSA